MMKGERAACALLGVAAAACPNSGVDLGLIDLCYLNWAVEIEGCHCGWRRRFLRYVASMLTVYFVYIMFNGSSGHDHSNLTTS